MAHTIQCLFLSSFAAVVIAATGCESDQPRMVTETAEQSFDDIAEQAAKDAELSESAEE